MKKVTVGGGQNVIYYYEGVGSTNPHKKDNIIGTTVLEVHPDTVFGNIFLTKTAQPTKQFGVAGLHR